MNTLSVINATGASPYSVEPFGDGPSAFDRVLSLATRLSGAGVLVLCAAGSRHRALAEERGIRCTVRDTWTMLPVLQEMAVFCGSNSGVETVLYFHADTPFVDEALAMALVRLHGQYRAEYTFADGYPPGFSPEVLAARSVPAIVDLASRYDVPADRDGLFAVIQKDINSFDIETHLSPADLRLYRFSPVCDTRRNMIAASRLWALGARTAADALAMIPLHPELLRTVPAFLWVQVVAGCPQSCSHCPYPLMAGDPRTLDGYMPPTRFADIINQAVALSDDLVVDVSLWGEPALHPDFEALADEVLKHAGCTLIVETSGLGWKPGVAERVAAAGGARVQWIVSLDDPTEDGYRRVRGEGYAEAVGFADRMLRVTPGNLHVQAVRMKDNEPRLEAFYRGWKERGAKVIVQKYDPFASSLPDLAVADLSPLERLPCRHLARDMAILLDGSVPPCKHALQRTADGRLSPAATLGNVFSEGLPALWKAMDAWYDRHTRKDYPEPCGKCDEYHTYNA